MNSTPITSKVIATWSLVSVWIPKPVRESPEWQALACVAEIADSSLACEKQRANLVVNHMWEVALPLLDTALNLQGCMYEWRNARRTRSINAVSKIQGQTRVTGVADLVAVAKGLTGLVGTYQKAGALSAEDKAEAASIVVTCVARAVGTAPLLGQSVPAWVLLDPVNLLQELVK